MVINMSIVYFLIGIQKVWILIKYSHHLMNLNNKYTVYCIRYFNYCNLY